jgi:hypothetical protein
LKSSYPPKILLAWAEAIGGNRKIRDWLMGNGFPELAFFEFALHHKEDARKWLMEHGFQHLMATIAAVERNQSALNWLKNYNFDVLAHAALAADGNEDGFNWLIKNGHREMAIVAKRIQIVKDQIERDNNDIHKISKT